MRVSNVDTGALVLEFVVDVPNKVETSDTGSSTSGEETTAAAAADADDDEDEVTEHRASTDLRRACATLWPLLSILLQPLLTLRVRKVVLRFLKLVTKQHDLFAGSVLRGRT